MSWSEPIVIAWIQRLGLHLTRVAQCAWVEPQHQLKKSWMIASSFPLPELETQCTHQHPSFKGKRDVSGNFISQQTSCYPHRMTQHLAKSSSHLVTQKPEVGTWENALEKLPAQAPMPNEGSSLSCADGGGISSHGDWTSPKGSDVFSDLHRACSKYSGKPAQTKKLISNNGYHGQFFLLSRIGLTPISSTGQPFLLHLRNFAAITPSDPELTLITLLQDGGMCGVEAPIEPGGAWIPTDSTPTDVELTGHEVNWQSAMDHLDLAEELVQRDYRR